MARTPKTPKTPVDVKPYMRSSTSPSPASSADQAPPSLSTPSSKTAEFKAKSTPSPSTSPSKSKAWTTDELLQLFDKVSKAGAGRKTWEGAVEGRTPNQCYQAWIGTITPYLRKALAEKSTR